MKISRKATRKEKWDQTDRNHWLSSRPLNRPESAASTSIATSLSRPLDVAATVHISPIKPRTPMFSARKEWLLPTDCWVWADKMANWIMELNTRVQAKNGVWFITGEGCKLWQVDSCVYYLSWVHLGVCWCRCKGRRTRAEYLACVREEGEQRWLEGSGDISRHNAWSLSLGDLVR